MIVYHTDIIWSHNHGGMVQSTNHSYGTIIWCKIGLANQSLDGLKSRITLAINKTAYKTTENESQNGRRHAWCAMLPCMLHVVDKSSDSSWMWKHVIDRIWGRYLHVVPTASARMCRWAAGLDFWQDTIAHGTAPYHTASYQPRYHLYIRIYVGIVT